MVRPITYRVTPSSRHAGKNNALTHEKTDEVDGDMRRKVILFIEA